MGGPPPDDSLEGQRRHRLFQGQVFSDVFGVRGPEFAECDPKNLTPTVTAAQHVWLRQKERSQVYFEMAKTAALERGVLEGAVDP